MIDGAFLGQYNKFIRENCFLIRVLQIRRAV
jgi:hypothetical protein